MISPERKARKQALFTEKVEAVEAKMKAEGWNPVRLRSHSKRYRCAIPGKGERVVAVKVMGMSYRGAIGFRQKIDGKWRSPLTDSDCLLYATPHEQGIGVWLFPMERVIERLEAVQRIYDERGWADEAALWINIFDHAQHHRTADPLQLDFAQGKPPMWLLPMEQSAEAEIGESAAAEQPNRLPSLASYTVGQLIDELQRRGLKSFSF